MPNLGDQFAAEAEAKAQPICPHCGGVLTRSQAWVTTKDDCGPMELPPYCPSKECRDVRDDAAMRAAIARGTIVCCHCHSETCHSEPCCELCPTTVVHLGPTP